MDFARKKVALPSQIGQWITTPAVRWLALLGLFCAAYLQGGLDKSFDLNGVIDELRNFGIAPAAPMAIATIITELVGSALILTGFYRWLGAFWLAGFSLIATFIANRFWELQMPQRFVSENTFFEHLGLVGGFLLVAWQDLVKPSTPPELQSTIRIC